MFYETANNDHGLPRDPFKAIVVPRPIGWASTVSAAGVANLAPFSFFTVVCVIPPMISLTIARNPDGSEKHTLKHIRQTGEFCINVVTQPVWREMVDSANAIPEEESEFTKTGLTPIPSLKVKPPRVKEAPIHFECKLHQVVELGPRRHPLVIGEVPIIDAHEPWLTLIGLRLVWERNTARETNVPPGGDRR